ncbi:unnamed protein product [Adineta ricciae]|uniref:EGF-like domain-containing protein n=1 Tax=Adineta ricciae TaxID=249248 RepID=A0A813UCF6_ADIRI|nr:unnamed protein product [Adineta ricciae]
MDYYIALVWTMLMIGEVKAVSYNQPKFCPNASWHPNATTFATVSVVGLSPYSLFVDTNDTVVTVNRHKNQTLIWANGSVNPTTILPTIFSDNWSVFITDTNDIYIDINYNSVNYRVEKWGLNGTQSSSNITVSGECGGLFVDINNTLYCSMYYVYKVISQSLNSSTSSSITVAGDGTPGSTSTRLNRSSGIFVTVNFKLYVADYGNNRIQSFELGNLTGTTVSVNVLTSPNTLNGPTGVVMDADNNLFILDSSNNRIVGSSVNGFRCIVGCLGTSGSASYQLTSAWSLSFDSAGNIFVSDSGNGRIQKFVLSKNECNQSTTTIAAAELTTSVATTTDQSSSTSQPSTTDEWTSTSTTGNIQTSPDSITSTTVLNQTVNSSHLLFITSTCADQQWTGVYCNVSNRPCETINPCQNSGSCFNDNTTVNAYLCQCLQGFDGPECQNDRRICKLNTCFNSGQCNETSNQTYECLCAYGWANAHCETQINYCESNKCRHCEVVGQTMIAHQIAAKSLAYVAIIFITVSVMFFILMDALKYVLGIDLAKEEMDKIEKGKKAKQKSTRRQPPVFQKFVYVDSATSAGQ